MNKDGLIRFEHDIAEEFNAGRIHAPVHLSAGNEDELIGIFRHIRSEDWVLCSWRSHYHCLLKGVPPNELRAAIMAGRSISLCFPEHRIFSSAIVGGIVPIAVGLGMSIARSGGPERVYCFVGDMTAETGAFAECLRYVENHDLPVMFVIEDNGRSIDTDTRAVWSSARPAFDTDGPHLRRYRYVNSWPHAGAGQRVKF